MNCSHSVHSNLSAISKVNQQMELKWKIIDINKFIHNFVYV